MRGERVARELQQLRPLMSILYLATGGTLCVVAVMTYLRLPFSPIACLISTGVIFAIYTVNRFTDTREDFVNDSYRSIFFTQRKGILYAALGLMAAALVFLTVSGHLNAYFLALVALGMAYSVRIIPWPGRSGWRMVRFKDIPVTKNVLVAILWGVSAFAVPVLLSGVWNEAGLPLDLALLAGGLSLSTLNSTLFCDVLDIDGDRLAGNRTLPVLVGHRAPVLFLMILNAVWLGAITVLASTTNLDAGVLRLLAVLALYPFCYQLPHLLWRTPRAKLEFWCELDLLLFALGMVIIA